MSGEADTSEYHRPWCLCPNGHWWLGWPKVVNVCTECSLGAASEHAYPSGLVAALDGIEQAATMGWSGPPTTPAQAEAMEQDCQCHRVERGAIEWFDVPSPSSTSPSGGEG